MKARYDFSKGRRGAVMPMPKGKERITIRLDRKVLAWFKAKVEAQGGGNYQTMINAALAAYIEHEERPLEVLLRRVVREELGKRRQRTAA